MRRGGVGPPNDSEHPCRGEVYVECRRDGKRRQKLERRVAVDQRTEMMDDSDVMEAEIPFDPKLRISRE